MEKINNLIPFRDFIIDERIIKILPKIRLGIYIANVHVIESNQEIRNIIGEITKSITSRYIIDDINKIDAIAKTRYAYMRLGKDPSRYRPSAEALCRRIVNGKELFNVNNIVDILNAISIETGYSIGGYDLDKIEGEIKLGIGMENEPYEAIGRGELNIHNLPVLRDDKGPFGSPTSDSVRTMVVPETKRFMMVIFDFEGNGNVEEVLQKSREYFHKYADVEEADTKVL